jgi:hypothetical protein
MRDQLLDAVALGRRILRVAAHIQVQARTVSEENIAAATPRNYSPEEITSYFIRAKSPLATKRAGDSVLGFDSEDAAVHSPTVGVRAAVRFLLLAGKDRSEF